MRTRTLTRRSALVGVLLATSLVLGAKAQDSWWGYATGWSSQDNGRDQLFQETRNILVDHVADKPLSVLTENGGISVVASPDVSGVSIVAKVRARSQERLQTTKVVTARLQDGTLEVRVVWPDEKRRSNEGVSLEVRLPDARGVTLAASNGPLSISGLKGSAELRTSNGPVTVSRHDGPVNTNTSNGPVTVRGVAAQVTVDTSNGPVEVADVLGPVTVDTSNGPVIVELRPEASGPVRCDTSNGPIRLFVGSAFTGTVKADTSNARVRVSGIDASRTTMNKSEATVRFTDSGPQSVLDTSNGPVEITRR